MKEITIIPLGTVSPFPYKEHNCPGFLVKYNDKKILLDCGNGITRYLHLPYDLENLNIIITHLHKDHFGDIGCLQYASYVYHNLGRLKERIQVYLPKNDIGYNKKSITSNEESYSEYHDINEDEKIKIDDLNISFKDNHSHNIESYMIKLENEDFKIIYTSDIGTTNLEEAAEFCKNSDLIICESTYLKRSKTNSKYHLTIEDAALLANKSRSRELLLTHLWPEYNFKDHFDDSLEETYLERAKQIFRNLDIAEENKKLVLRRY